MTDPYRRQRLLCSAEEGVAGWRGWSGWRGCTPAPPLSGDAILDVDCSITRVHQDAEDEEDRNDLQQVEANCFCSSNRLHDVSALYLHLILQQMLHLILNILSQRTPLQLNNKHKLWLCGYRTVSTFLQISFVAQSGSSLPLQLCPEAFRARAPPPSAQRSSLRTKETRTSCRTRSPWTARRRTQTARSSKLLRGQDLGNPAHLDVRFHQTPQLGWDAFSQNTSVLRDLSVPCVVGKELQVRQK